MGSNSIGTAISSNVHAVTGFPRRQFTIHYDTVSNVIRYLPYVDLFQCKSKNFENQARNLEKAILDYLKKQKVRNEEMNSIDLWSLKDTAKALTPKESKDKIEKVDKIEKTDKTDNKKEEKTVRSYWLMKMTDWITG